MREKVARDTFKASDSMRGTFNENDLLPEHYQTPEKDSIQHFETDQQDGKIQTAVKPD